MKRAVYDKQFKMAVVNHAQSEEQSVNEVCIAGLNTISMEKVRFLGMETHFSIRPMKLRNCKSKTKNYKWRTSF